MGAMPDDLEEPAPSQLAALNKRVVKLLAALYVDFAIWTPFERRAAKSHKFRANIAMVQLAPVAEST